MKRKQNVNTGGFPSLLLWKSHITLSFCLFLFVFFATVSGHDASGCIVLLYAFFQVLHLSSVQSYFFVVLFSLSSFLDVHMSVIHVSWSPQLCYGLWCQQIIKWRYDTVKHKCSLLLLLCLSWWTVTSLRKAFAAPFISPIPSPSCFFFFFFFF